MVLNLENKWFRGAIPALLLHCCIGSVYCWSLLKRDIATMMGCEISSIEFAFSLAIFFLGMSAAFGGRYIEKNVKKSSLLSMICFSVGLFGTIYAINIGSIPLLFTFYGGVMGIGLGLGYLSPVKTLMLWFKEHKGLATGIAISGFGLSKVLFSPFIEWCNAAHGVTTTLCVMACISIVCMGLAALIIHKPKGWMETKNSIKIIDAIKTICNMTYIKIWTIFYINITCGLALIAFEKDLGLQANIANIGMLAALTALFNTIGRFGFSTASDYLKDKSMIYVIIFILSLLAVFGNATIGITTFGIILMLCLVNAGYGGGFSTLPTLLESRFGMKNISMIHGCALSAWAWAGLSGNQLSNFVLNTCHGTYIHLFIILGCLYTLALIISVQLLKKD